MTIDEIRVRAKNRLVFVREQQEESRRIDHNSYGAGYDDGFGDALQILLNTLDEDCPDIENTL